MTQRRNRPPYPWRSLLGIVGQAAVEAVLAAIPALAAWPFILLLCAALFTPVMALTPGSLDWPDGWIPATLTLSFLLWVKLVTPAWRDLFLHELQWNHRLRVEEAQQQWATGVTAAPPEHLLRPAATTETLLQPASGRQGNTEELLLRSADHTATLAPE
jgi:hypothetical protein